MRSAAACSQCTYWVLSQDVPSLKLGKLEYVRLHVLESPKGVTFSLFFLVFPLKPSMRQAGAKACCCSACAAGHCGIEAACQVGS